MQYFKFLLSQKIVFFNMKNRQFLQLVLSSIVYNLQYFLVALTIQIFLFFFVFIIRNIYKKIIIINYQSNFKLIIFYFKLFSFIFIFTHFFIHKRTKYILSSLNKKKNKEFFKFLVRKASQKHKKILYYKFNLVYNEYLLKNAYFSFIKHKIQCIKKCPNMFIFSKWWQKNRFLGSKKAKQKTKNIGKEERDHYFV